MEIISMLELKKRLETLKPGEVVLDVRTEDEYRDGHVHGSINIPHDQVASRISDLKKYSKIYIHCRSGGRAGVAFEALSRLGLSNLVCIPGSGILDWIAAGYPLEK